jgi:osomolarity two-component system sensor histidine kinase NIK1
MFNLKRYDYDITAVTNGLDAMEAVKNNRFDLILMDIMLPEMNGFEVTEKIRSFENEQGLTPVPIVALTANTLDNDREKCISIGMNEYLSKPFTADQLLEKIEKFVQLEV